MSSRSGHKCRSCRQCGWQCVQWGHSCLSALPCQDGRGRVWQWQPWWSTLSRSGHKCRSSRLGSPTAPGCSSCCCCCCLALHPPLQHCSWPRPVLQEPWGCTEGVPSLDAALTPVTEEAVTTQAGRGFLPHPQSNTHTHTHTCTQKLGNHLSWGQHVASVVRAASYRLYMLRRLRSLGTPANELKGVYTSFILPKLVSASPVLNLFSSNVALRDHLLFISMLLLGEKRDGAGRFRLRRVWLPQIKTSYELLFLFHPATMIHALNKW